MQRQANPTLPGEDWEGYREYVLVDYTDLPWNSRYWKCPVCSYTNTVRRTMCEACFRFREKKVVGYNRQGNPVEKWVMHR